MNCKITDSERLNSSKEDLRSLYTSKTSKKGFDSSKRKVEESNAIKIILEEEEKSEKQITTPEMKK